MQLSDQRLRRRAGILTTVHRHLWAPLAVALALAALTASTASADRHADPAARSPVPADHNPPAPTTIRVVRVTSVDRFSWGDAAIGGAAVLALTMIVVGGALAMSHRTRAFPGARN